MQCNVVRSVAKYSDGGFTIISMCAVDVSKAFDKVNQTSLAVTLGSAMCRIYEVYCCGSAKLE